MKTCFLRSLIVAALLASPAFAEKAPSSLEDLPKQADLIVVATIDRIRVESESSHFEPGLGNSDWGIYLTVRVETVEKGDCSDRELELRCFRIKRRRSITESLSPSGHHPIPAPGTRVRAHLQGRSGRAWNVVLPNGIVPLDSDGLDALEVKPLRGGGYTFILPMELWGLLMVGGVPVGLCGTYIIRRRKSRRLSETER